ncbi:SKA complex subunit 1 isoform X2 [Poecilia latipinna]|nr:PREDICTED: spindle and kinetochore-associated protein 1 isoform X2 [Poecilia latipinna]
MADLEEIYQHFQNKLSSLLCMLDLSAADLPQQKIKKLGQEVLGLGRMLEEFEKCVDQQKEQLQQLKVKFLLKCLELEKLFQNYLESVQHMKDNFPAHIPKRKSPVKDNKPADNQPAWAEKTKKINRNFVKEVDYITTQEYESIPQ